MTGLHPITDSDARDADHIIVVPPRRPEDFAIPLSDGRRLWISPPLATEELPGLLEVLLREGATDGPTTAARTCLPNNIQRQRKPRKPTLASAAKQARKAGIEVGRYEIKPDGSIVIVPGQPAPDADANPWDVVSAAREQ